MRRIWHYLPVPFFAGANKQRTRNNFLNKWPASYKQPQIKQIGLYMARFVLKIGKGLGPDVTDKENRKFFEQQFNVLLSNFT